MPNIHPDVSKWQPAVDGTFNRPFLMFRALAEQGGIDSKASTNLAWCVAARRSGKLTNFGVYVIPEFVSPAILVAGLDALGVPHDCVVMIDWESWSGKLSGDHSVRLNNLADRLRARQGGRPDLVWGYSNRGDLNGWRTRPAWLGMIIAGYNSNDPRDDGIPNVIGWQYSNGTENHTTYPSSTPPFGRCDHNVLFIDYPTPTPGSHDISGRGSTTEDIIMDDATRAYLDAKFDAAHTDAKTIIQGDAAHPNSQNAIAAKLNALIGATNPAKLAASLAPLLTAGQPISQAELESALRTVLGSVDNPP